MEPVKKILVVEDEPDIRKVLMVRLEINGFEPVGAEDGERAMELARKEKPDLILLDLMIPKLSGFDVCRMVRFDESIKHIPIIVLSAMTQPRDRDQAMQNGANAFFVKPYKLADLIEKIRQLAG